MGSAIMTLNAAIINLNIRRILMSHCGRDKNVEHTPLSWLKMRFAGAGIDVRSQTQNL
jgi:hypothetical protein